MRCTCALRIGLGHSIPVVFLRFWARNSNFDFRVRCETASPRHPPSVSEHARSVVSTSSEEVGVVSSMPHTFGAFHDWRKCRYEDHTTLNRREMLIQLATCASSTYLSLHRLTKRIPPAVFYSTLQNVFNR